MSLSLSASKASLTTPPFDMAHHMRFSVARLSTGEQAKSNATSVAMDAAADGQYKARTCWRHRVNDHASHALLNLGLAWPPHANRVIYDDRDVTKQSSGSDDVVGLVKLALPRIACHAIFGLSHSILSERSPAPATLASKPSFAAHRHDRETMIVSSLVPETNQWA